MTNSVQWKCRFYSTISIWTLIISSMCYFRLRLLKWVTMMRYIIKDMLSSVKVYRFYTTVQWKYFTTSIWTSIISSMCYFRLHLLKWVTMMRCVIKILFSESIDSRAQYRYEHWSFHLMCYFRLHLLKWYEVHNKNTAQAKCWFHSTVSTWTSIISSMYYFRLHLLKWVTMMRYIKNTLQWKCRFYRTVSIWTSIISSMCYFRLHLLKWVNMMRYIIKILFSESVDFTAHYRYEHRSFHQCAIWGYVY